MKWIAIIAVCLAVLLYGLNALNRTEIGLEQREDGLYYKDATTLGPLKPDLASETGLANLNVVSSLSHDTACAVAACPAEGERWAYISSGTWSLMGLEIPEPIITDACRELNFTNEIGYGGSIRLLKNIIGLWLVQECRRAWAAQGIEYSYAD